MSTEKQDALDSMLTREFGGFVREMADDGFADRVLARIRRRVRVRAVTLSFAALAGLAIAFGPIMYAASLLSQFTPVLPEVWRQIDPTGQHGYLVAAVLMGLASPLLIRVLER